MSSAIACVRVVGCADLDGNTKMMLVGGNNIANTRTRTYMNHWTQSAKEEK